jgi:hypothetical protein
MALKETFEKVMNWRMALVILLVAIVWRAVISLDGEIAFWESLLSGIALILLGWVLFAYMFLMFKELKGWIISNYIYEGIALGLVIINLYVLVYYGTRWYRLLHVEVYLPSDYVFRNINFMALVVFYCAVIWLAPYLKKMHEDYISQSKEKSVLHIISPYLYTRRKKLREMGVKELISTVITDERTLLVLIGFAFLWRIVISFDYTVSLRESMASGIFLIVVGWLFFGYIYSLSKQSDWFELVKVDYGIALGVLAINIYVFFYYIRSWYDLASVGGVPEAFVTLDYLFRDANFFAFLLFYFASIVLSKFLKRAHEEYSLLSSGEAPKAAS